jgi:hypothetical protein
MPDVLEDALPLTTGGDVKPFTELEVGECFAPFIPQISVSPAPALKRKRPTFKELLDETFRRNGWDSPDPTDPAPETGTSTSPEAGSTGDTDAPVAEPAEILPTPDEVPLLPAPRRATLLEIFTWLKRCLLAQTPLHEEDAELVAFWVVSTWFQDALTVLPCLVITGPAHYAGVVLHVLGDFCRGAKLIAGFRRSHLEVLRRSCQTNLVWEPNLDRRTADLLSSLTDPSFSVVEGGYLRCHSKSTAIYAGENPGAHKIQNSIHIHITPTKASPPARAQGLQEMTKHIPVHLGQYRETNIDHVRHWKWAPTDLLSETAAIATGLGSGIVDAPRLQTKVITLLKSRDKQLLSEMSDSPEAVVVEATLALSRDGRAQAYVREIAAEVNLRLETRGETVRLSPEKVGHRLKKVGLRTRPLSQIGNGLTFDKDTITLIQRLAALYMVEDMLEGDDNLHGPQTPDNK